MLILLTAWQLTILFDAPPAKDKLIARLPWSTVDLSQSPAGDLQGTRANPDVTS
jgi:hypothetical protein